MGYRVGEIKLFKEESFNVAPATPKVKVIKSSSFDLSSEQRSETIEFVGNGHEPNKKVYGDFDYSGSLGLVLGGDYMPILCEGVIGEASTVENATTDTHTSTTVYAKGDIVNHSNGVNSLVCFVGGTSDATEPTITTEEDGDRITDGTVTWIVRPLLKKRAGTLQACLPSFAIERKDIASCTVADDNYESFTGVMFESLELKKEGGEIKFEVSQNVKGMGQDSSISNASYVPFDAGVALAENFYSGKDVTIEYNNGTDWVALEGFDTFSLSISRTVEITYIATGETNKRIDFGNTTIEGSASGLMSVELYNKSFNKDIVPVRFVYSKFNGDKSVIAFSNVEFGTSKNNIQAGKDILIDINISAFGKTTESSVSYECITSVDL